MSTAVDREPLLNREQAAAFLNVRPQTLSAWACLGRHNLPVIKVGRSVRYRMRDLNRWLEQRTFGAVEE